MPGLACVPPPGWRHDWRGDVVMAGAMVTPDVPPYAVVSGVPAKVILQRELQQPSYSLNYRPLFE
jgi:serine acetyltransferase